MASTKIQNLPLKAPIGAMKIPTGGFGDYSITVSSIGDFIIDAFNLVTKDYVDNLLVEKEDRIDLTGGYLTPTSQNANVPDTTNDTIDEVAQALLDRIEYVKDVFGNRPLHNELNGRSEINAHPSTSISHGSGTVSSKFSSLDSNLNNINNNLIPNINNNILLKEDKIVNGNNFTEEISFSPVPSTSSPFLNTSLQELANRDEFLNVQFNKGINPTFDQAFADKIGGYPLNSRLMLDNGDIVRSTIAANTVNPNVDMTGWVKVNAAEYIEFSDGSNVQELFDTLGRKDYVVITPEMFGAKANDSTFDNTVALNNAFATGKNVYSTPDKTYYVTGSLRTRGQRTIGGWKINSTKATGRAGTWSKLVTTSDTGLDTSNNIRMIYVSSAWDLSEFLAIKALGFNTIHHYVGMSGMGWDWDGDVFDVLNNAMTAGLKVSLGTEQDPNAISDLAAWVVSVDNYPALWAYSVYDEPVARGFTVAQQDARIATMRGLTNKKLITVDYESNPFVQKYSTNYDLVFVNSYSKPWGSGDLLAQDLDKMRKDYGVLKAQVKCPVVPCISAFGSAPETFYASNLGQIIKASKIFGTIDGGNFAAFVWDGEADTSITSAVRDSSALQGLVRYLTAQQSRKPLRTDVYLFGNAETQTDWGLKDVINRIASPDSSATDPMNVNAYPIKIKQGATNTDRTSTTSNMNYSGIGFKGANARLVTTIELLKYLKLHLEYVNVDGDVPFSTIEFCSTYDAYDLVTEYSYAATDNSVIEGSYTISQPNISSLAFKYTNTSAVVKGFYRQLLRGLIVCTDW